MKNEKLKMIFIYRLFWVILVFSIIWGSKLPGITLPMITLYPIRIFTLLWMITKLMKGIRTKKLYIARDDIPILIFFGYGCTTVLWSYDSTASFTAIIVYLTSLLCYWMCKNASKKEVGLQYICEAFYINVIIMATIAVYESITGQYMSLSYEYYTRTYNMFGLFRPIAAFYNTNNLAVFMISCLPISMLATEKWRLKNFGKTIIFVVTTIVLLLCDSRAGLLGLIMFVALYLYHGLYVSHGSKKF